MPPHDVQMDWVRFLDTNPSTEAIGDWLELKAAEIGWSFFDLSVALSAGVRKPQLPEPTPEPEPTLN